MTLTTNSVNGVDDPSTGYIYKFRLQNINDSSNIIWVNTYEPTIDLTDNIKLRSGTTYNVKVRVENHPYLSQYSIGACQISTHNLSFNKTSNFLEDKYKTLNSDASKFVIYPNPVVSDNFTIKLSLPDSTKPLKICLYDVLGKKYRDLKIDHSLSEISLSTIKLEKGIYFLVLDKNNFKETKKVIIQ